MKKVLFILLLIFMLVPEPGQGQGLGVSGTPSLTVEEIDGAPSIRPVRKVQVPNGSLSDQGNGIVRLTISGTGDVQGPATNHDGYVPQWNGADSKTLKDGIPFSANGITLMGETFAQMLTSIGAAAAAHGHSGVYQPAAANLTTWAGIAPTANGQTLMGETFAQMLTSIGAAAAAHGHSGVYQPAAANLTTWAGIAPTANGQTLMGETFAQMLTSIGAAAASHAHAATDLTSGALASVDRLPALAQYYFWIGNASGRPEATNSLPIGYIRSGVKYCDAADATKCFQFGLSGISTETTRTITVPNRAFTFDYLTTATETNITGILKGTGSLVAAASAGTDYPGLASTNAFTGANTVGDTSSNNLQKVILQKATSMADHAWQGTAILGTAGENLAQGDIVYKKYNASAWKYYKYDCDGTGKLIHPSGIATAAISSAADGVILIKGVMRDDTWNITSPADGPTEVCASETAGGVQLCSGYTPGTGDQVVVVGLLVGTNVIETAFGYTWVEK